MCVRVTNWNILELLLLFSTKPDIEMEKIKKDAWDADFSQTPSSKRRSAHVIIEIFLASFEMK
jgi:hypothetical protein